MDDRTNTIAGWVLGAGIVALGTSVLTGEIFHAERPEKMGYPIEGVEVEAEGAAAEQPIAFYLASADPARGEQVFKKCTTCHNADKGGANQLGPNLWGIVGSPHAAKPGFAYSHALKTVSGAWGWDGLSEWLKSPKTYAPGNKMTFPGLSKPEDRANVIAFLNQRSDNPLPMPAAPTASAETSNAPAEKEPVPTEAQAAQQPKGNVGGEGAPTVTGRAEQTRKN
jgi:cytochrome c